MNNMPTRDTTGKCEGECRNRVFEGMEDRQSAINSSGKRYDTPSDHSLSWSHERNEPPGFLGGRV